MEQKKIENIVQYCELYLSDGYQLPISTYTFKGGLGTTNNVRFTLSSLYAQFLSDEFRGVLDRVVASAYHSKLRELLTAIYLAQKDEVK